MPVKTRLNILNYSVTFGLKDLKYAEQAQECVRLALAGCGHSLPGKTQ
jgi:hypothetical protein